MSISIFPTPAAEDTSVNNLKYNVVAASSSGLYKGSQVLKPGIYTITCISTTNTTVTFWNGSTEILSATTSSGTVNVNLPNGATSFYYSINTGTSISIDIQRVANPVAYAAAVVDILTSSASYTHTGKAYVVAVGGGEGGQSSEFSGGGFSGVAGRGGKSGGIAADLLTLSGTVNYTVGAAGNSNGPGGGGNPNAGGNSTFSNVVTSANVGQGNGGAAANNTGSGGAGNAGTASAYSFVVTGTTGGGGGGARNYGRSPGNGAGSGIGSGGRGGEQATSNDTNGPTNGGNANGYGGGGGGSGASDNVGRTGGNGGPGVIYVLKLPQ
jgi:hypothetical protein